MKFAVRCSCWPWLCWALPGCAPSTPPAAPPSAPTGQAAPADAALHDPHTVARFAEGDLLITVDAPTAGCKLQQDALRRTGTTADLELTLSTPGVDEVVAQVVTPIDLRIAGSELQDIDAVRVLIATVQRGASYLVAPAHELTARAARP